MSDKSDVVEALFFDEKTAEILVEKTAKLVTEKLVSDRKIRFDSAQMENLAETTAKYINISIDYAKIAENALDIIPQLKNTDLLFNENIRTDLIEKIKRFIPDPIPGRDGRHGEHGKDGRDGRSGVDYLLTEKDRADIAEEALTDISEGNDILELIISRVMASDKIVSRERFSNKLKELKAMIDSVKKNSNKKTMNAGISGQDMIDEITKTFGSEVWQGGGGGVSDLTYDEVIKTIDSDALLTDMQKVVRYENEANNRVYTIEDNGVIAYPLKSWVEVYRNGSGELSIVRGSNVVFEGLSGDNNFKIAGTTGNSVTLRQRLSNIWVYTGSIKAF